MARARSTVMGFWGEPPWRVDFQPEPRPLPAEVDLAIVGGGLTGLAVACAFSRRAPERSLAVLEAETLGSGASGRTGGIVLDETSFGPLPGLGNVLDGFARALEEWKIDCELILSSCWEISRRSRRMQSPITWNDSGILRVENSVAGGTVDPGKLATGLASAAERVGAALYETTPVRGVRFSDPIELELRGQMLRARQVVFATEAYPHPFAGMARNARFCFTLALATAPLAPEQLSTLGLEEKIPFYTLDLPYLWGRVFGENQVIFGGGLVEVRTPEELAAIDIRTGQAAERQRVLEERVRGLVPAMRNVDIRYCWGGPISFPHAGRPIFLRHPESPSALVLGGYAGQGIALGVHLSQWVAEAFLAGRPLPAWGTPVWS